MKTKLSVFIFLMSISFTGLAQIINVPLDQPTIQAGIDAATNGDTVLVDADTYFENINFNGKAITVASYYIVDGDTNHINNTIIDGSQPANPDNGSVVTFSLSEDSTSVICGFTITGGTGTYIGSIDQQYGGGIYCSYAGAKIIHNKIINNTCEYSNQASGGGIGCRFGSSWIVIRDNTIRDNVASSDNDALGGGIYSRYNSLIISNNVISHDSLSGYNTYGGAVCISYTYHTEMTGNIITRNKVNNIDIYWNGIYFFNPIGPVNIFQNEFSYHEGEYTVNGACGGLGFYHASNNPVVVDGNLFIRNSVKYGGGFIEVNSYNLKLTNNVFIGNEASEGGAIRIYHQGSSNEYRPRIINNTFFNNSALGYGGAISYIGEDIGSSPVIMNCIFWENSAPTGKDIDNWSSDTIFVYYSDIEHDHISGQWLGEFNFYEDPELEDDDIHLSGSSPCINMGTDSLDINGITYACPEFDIDGDARPLNNGVEIGADEKLYIGILDLVNEHDDPLIQVYPNPFTTETTLEYELNQPSKVHVIIFNQLGEKVMEILNNCQAKGINEIGIDLNGLEPGVYFCTLKTNNGIQTKKLIKVE